MIGPAYNSLKDWTRAMTGVSDTMLHVGIGLGIYVLVALILRRGWRSPLPLAAVVVIEVLNEIGDYLIHSSWRWPSPLVDGFNTIALPLGFYLVIRLREALLGSQLGTTGARRTLSQSKETQS